MERTDRELPMAVTGEDPRIVELRELGARVGAGVFLGPDVYVERDFAPLLTVEDGVVLARGVCILLHDSALNNVAGLPVKLGRVTLRRECYVGANTTILCGVEVGERAIVGACSLVTRDVPAGTVAFGQPARVAGTLADVAARAQPARPAEGGRFRYVAISPWRDRRASPRPDGGDEKALRDALRELAAETRMEPTTSAGAKAIEPLDPGALDQILRRIDENLVRPPDDRRLAASELAHQIRAVAELRAPYYRPHGGLLKRTLMRLLNLPLRVFGRPQSFFNDDLMRLLTAVVEQLERLERERARLEQLDRALREQRAGWEQLAEHIGREQRGQDEWIRLVDRKLLNLARDVREQRAAPAESPAIPEPRIVDPEGFARRVAAMGGRPRVNLGAGEKPLPGYINVDARPLPEIDVVADVRRLPFEPGTVAEIASAHLVEHFREHQLRAVILPYWHSLLQPGGFVRIVCPNWQAMIERLGDGRMSIDEFKLLTFGGQDYEGDDHFAMYTPETLGALLTECGFARVELAVAERMNSICPEMEVLAYRP